MNAATQLRVRGLYDAVLRWSSRADNREFMFVEPRERLARLANGEALPLGVLLTTLEFLDSWYSAVNIADLARDRTSDFATLHLGHRYGFWDTLIAQAASQALRGAKRRPQLSARTVAIRTARAAALGSLRDCRVLGTCLTKGLESDLFVPDGSIIAPFVVHLFCEWQGIAAPQVVVRSEIMTGVLESWTEEDLSLIHI